MNTIKGFEENYEVQGIASTSEVGELFALFDTGRDGVLLYRLESGSYEFRIRFSAVNRRFLRRQGLANFSQVIDLGDLLEYVRHMKESPFAAAATTPCMAVWQYWLNKYAWGTFRDPANYESARKG